MALTLRRKAHQDGRIMLEPVDGSEADLHVEGLIAGQVVRHGSEHAVAVFAYDDAGLQTVDGREHHRWDGDAPHWLQVWLRVQWLA